METWIKYDLKMSKKLNRIKFSNELLVVYKVVASRNKSKSISTYLNSNKNEWWCLFL